MSTRVPLDVIPGGRPAPVTPSPQAELGEARLPTSPLSNLPQRVIGIAALIAILYFGKVVWITLIVAVLLAFLLEPLAGGMERWHVSRPVGAAVALVLATTILYLGTYFFYVRAQEFAHQLPAYSQKIRQATFKYRKQAEQIQKTTESVIPKSADEDGAIKVKQVEGMSSEDQASLMETVLAASFIPFLAYFMLSWQQHLRVSLVKLFPRENRTTAYVAASRVSQMLRSFIVGNAVVGLIMGVVSAAVFFYFNIPYFYFIGLISGFLSLVPYLGVLLAMAPPLAVGIGVLKPAEFPIVAVIVVIIHLFGINVLYPKVLGKRMQLNPVVVTFALLFWGFLWGAMGLVLAIPLTAALKITCDHVESLRPLGDLLGEGASA
jgi:predicted PurR-regulated permease PerM